MAEESRDRWEVIFPWMEKRFGGRIVERRRQGRESGGRFAWFVDLEIDGRLRKTYVRGTRDDSFSYTRIYSTRREAAILEVLHREGLRVPEVLAFHDDPQAAVLGHIEGRDDFNNVKDPAERESILESFLQRLAELHAVDARKFESIGLRIPASPEELALHDLDVWHPTIPGSLKTAGFAAPAKFLRVSQRETMRTPSHSLCCARSPTTRERDPDSRCLRPRPSSSVWSETATSPCSCSTIRIAATR